MISCSFRFSLHHLVPFSPGIRGNLEPERDFPRSQKLDPWMETMKSISDMMSYLGSVLERKESIALFRDSRYKDSVATIPFLQNLQKKKVCFQIRIQSQLDDQIENSFNVCARACVLCYLECIFISSVISDVNGEHIITVAKPCNAMFRWSICKSCTTERSIQLLYKSSARVLPIIYMRVSIILNVTDLEIQEEIQLPFPYPS